MALPRRQWPAALFALLLVAGAWAQDADVTEEVSAQTCKAECPTCSVSPPCPACQQCELPPPPLINEAELTKLRDEASSLASEIKRLEAVVAEKDAAVEQSQSAFKTLKEETEGKIKALEDARNELEATKKKAEAEARRTADDLTKVKVASANEAAELKKKKLSLESEVKKLERSVSSTLKAAPAPNPMSGLRLIVRSVGNAVPEEAAREARKFWHKTAAPQLRAAYVSASAAVAKGFKSARSTDIGKRVSTALTGALEKENLQKQLAKATKLGKRYHQETRKGIVQQLRQWKHTRKYATPQVADALILTVLLPGLLFWALLPLRILRAVLFGARRGPAAGRKAAPQKRVPSAVTAKSAALKTPTKGKEPQGGGPTPAKGPKAPGSSGLRG